MKVYSRVEVAGAALVIMQQSKTKFCAGLVHPDKSSGEIEELYLTGVTRKHLNRRGRVLEERLMTELTTLKKATEQRDKMYQALASGKTQIKLAP